MKTKHQLLQEWNESTYGLEFGDYVYQYFVSEFNKPPVYGQWIDVKERTPEFDGKFLCFIEEPQECGNIWRYQEVVTIHFNVWSVKHNQTVTHWQALPPSPGSVDVEEKKECDYCKGTGFDPYPNHDTTMRPCPECENSKYYMEEQAKLLNATADRNSDLNYELSKANHRILQLTAENMKLKEVDGLGDSSGSEKEEEIACSILEGVEFKDMPQMVKAVYQLSEYLRKQSVKEVSREGEKDIHLESIITEQQQEIEWLTSDNERLKAKVGEPSTQGGEEYRAGLHTMSRYDLEKESEHLKQENERLHQSYNALDNQYHKQLKRVQVLEEALNKVDEALYIDQWNDPDIKEARKIIEQALNPKE